MSIGLDVLDTWQSSISHRPDRYETCTDWWKCTWRAIRIFCIWSTCTIPKARRYNRITADTGRTKQLVQIRLFAYSIYLVFAWPFKIIDPLSSYLLHYCLTIERSYRQKFDNVIAQLNKKLNFFFSFFFKSTDGIFSTISVRTYIANTSKNKRQRIKQNVANATDIFNDSFSHFRFMENVRIAPTTSEIFVFELRYLLSIQ